VRSKADDLGRIIDQLRGPVRLVEERIARNSHIDPTMSERKLIESSNLPGNRFDVYERDAPLEIYVDGVGQLLVGPTNSKIALYRVTDVNTEEGEVRESRELIARLTMPSRALGEFCATVLNRLRDNEDALLKGFEDERSKLLAVFKAAKT